MNSTRNQPLELQLWFQKCTQNVIVISLNSITTYLVTLRRTVVTRLHPAVSPSGPNCFVHKLDSKVQGANMGPIRGREAQGGPHVGPINFAISEYLLHCFRFSVSFTTSSSLNCKTVAYSQNYSCLNRWSFMKEWWRITMMALFSERYDIFYSV